MDDEDGTQINPPGFHVIPIPFADDLREISIETQPSGDISLYNRANWCTLFILTFSSDGGANCQSKKAGQGPSYQF